jgi:hypothetical protein
MNFTDGRGPTLGSGGVFSPLLSLPGLGIGIFFMLEGTSAPEIKARLTRRMTTPMAAKDKKIRCFPRSKPAMALGWGSKFPKLQGMSSNSDVGI